MKHLPIQEWNEEACWRRIGVSGDRSCPELAQHVHCRNCPVYAGAAQRLPARRVGQPEDVANAIVYLATTPYATGSTVLIDGGGAIA